MNEDCWYLIADHIRDPRCLKTLALVSKQFHRIFTSDRVWRYFNVHGLESGIFDRFIDDILEPKSNNNQNNTQFLLNMLEERYIYAENFECSDQLWWCLMNLIELDGAQLNDKYPDKCRQILDLIPHLSNAKLTLSKQYCRERELWMESFQYNFEVFGVPTEFQDDLEIMLKVIAKNSMNAYFAGPEVLASPEFLALVQKDAALLEYSPDHYRDNKQFVLSCHFKNWGALRFVSDRIRNDPDLVFGTIKHLSHQVIEDSPGRYRYVYLTGVISNKTLILVWCKFNEKNQRIIPFDVQAQLALEAMKMIKDFPHIYKHSGGMKEDLEFTLAAVCADGLVLEHVPDLEKCEDVCMAALTQNKAAMEFVPEHLRERCLYMLEH